MGNVDRIIMEVDGSMRKEGMELTEENKDNIRICLSDYSRYEEIKQSLIAKYSTSVSGVKNGLLL